MPITLQQIQKTNRKLRRLLELIQQQECGPLRLGAADLAGLLAELKMVEQLRAKNAQSDDPALTAELAEYRENLEDLHTKVPGMQARYRAEQARLERDRSHLNAASGWAQTQKMLHRR